jgi:hypothetical protein
MQSIQLEVVMPLRFTGQGFAGRFGLNRLHQAQIAARDEVVHQVLVVARLGSQNERKIYLLMILDERAVAGQAILDDDAFESGIQFANKLQQSPHCIAFAVVFVVAVLLDDRFDGDRQQVVAVMEHERFEHSTALQLVKNIGEALVQIYRVNLVEDFMVLRIAGDRLDPIQIHQAFILPPGIESQQGRFFEREHRKRRHQAIGQRVIDAPSSPPVSDRLKPTSQTVNQRTNREMFTCMGNRNFGQGMTLDDGPSFDHSWLPEG